jgi:hypothetical protein
MSVGEPGILNVEATEMKIESVEVVPRKIESDMPMTTSIIETTVMPAPVELVAGSIVADRIVPASIPITSITNTSAPVKAKAAKPVPTPEPEPVAEPIPDRDEILSDPDEFLNDLDELLKGN